MFQDDPTIYIPAVYEEYTTRRVLVLEWINGIKINDYTGLEAAGIDRLEVANRTVCAGDDRIVAGTVNTAERVIVVTPADRYPQYGFSSP